MCSTHVVVYVKGQHTFTGNKYKEVDPFNTFNVTALHGCIHVCIPFECGETFK